MMREASESGALDAAIQRLDRALGQLERQVTALAAQASAANGGLFDQDRSNLAAELDAARGRERALEAAGAQASEALGQAIVEIRSVLSAGDELDEIDVEGPDDNDDEIGGDPEEEA